MTTLQAVHGRIVELRRHTNVHLYGRRPLGPTDRYELWIKLPDEGERKFTVNTRHMPARRGHEVSLIITRHKVPRVLALANWSTIDGVNYARTDALARPSLGLHRAAMCVPGDGRRVWRHWHGRVCSRCSRLPHSDDRWTRGPPFPPGVASGSSYRYGGPAHELDAIHSSLSR